MPIIFTYLQKILNGETSKMSGVPKKTVQAIAIAGLDGTVNSDSILMLQIDTKNALIPDDSIKIDATWKNTIYQWTSTKIGVGRSVAVPSGATPLSVHKVTFECKKGRAVPPESYQDEPDQRLRGEDDLVVVAVTVTSGGTSTSSSGVAYLLP